MACAKSSVQLLAVLSCLVCACLCQHDGGGNDATNHEQNPPILDDPGQEGSNKPTTPMFPDDRGLFSNSLDDQARTFNNVVNKFVPIILGQKRRAEDQDQASIKLPFDNFLRMIGMDYSKIGLMLLNALIFIVETVATRYLGDNNDIGNLKSFRVNDIFNIQRAETFLRVAQDPTLPFLIIENMERRNRSTCMQQAVCKMAPMLWTVQRAMKDFNPISMIVGNKASRNEDGLVDVMWKYWPTYKDFLTNSDLCDKRYTRCALLSLLTRFKQEEEAPTLKPLTKPANQINSLETNDAL